MSRAMDGDIDEMEQVKRRLRRLENNEENIGDLRKRVEDLEEQLGDNHVGAVLDKLLSRLIEAENERDRMKQVLDVVCDEVGVDPNDVLEEGGE